MTIKRFNTEAQRLRDLKRKTLLNSLWLCVSVSLCYIFVLCSCIPAQTPPQLAFTPGAPAVITDELFTNSAFSVRYPTGWRVVTGAADAPPSVTFVAADDVSTITLTAADPGEPERDPAFRVETRQLSLEGRRIYVVARVPVQDWPRFQPTFERLLASVKPAS